MKVETQKYKNRDTAVAWFLSITAFVIIGCAPATIFSLEQPSNSKMATPQLL